MTVGDKRAFPGRADVWEKGITYRELLIASCAKGLCTIGRLTGQEIASSAIFIADRIIEQLDQEKSDHG